MLRRLLLMLALSTLSTAGLQGEEPFAFDQTPGRLPKAVVPRHYRIHVEPDLVKDTFTGRETIALEVRQPVRQIVLNQAGLTVTEAHLRAGATEMAVTLVASEAEQLLTLTAAQELPAGAYELELRWSGQLSEQPQGMHLLRFDSPAGEQKGLASQMEATDARRMFPCWDEPVFRAVFELSAVVPAAHLAFSNMPLTGERALPQEKKEVTFAPTPAMASYLVAFCSGQYEVLEGEAAGTHLRIITTPGKRQQGEYALQATKDLLPFYNEYFGTKYPLPKLDQFCFPGFSAGGMENWGCILYKDTTLLIDPKTATQSNRERVFEVVAHEIAHQWFGDLVTMAWWDNLWLNEGFATWMAEKATDHFNPTWQIMPRAATGKEWAMHRDARATTHPIQQVVKNEAQASDAFDEITYQKGGAFLRMLESWLGEDAFREGLRRYMAKHAMSSTTTADLWAALEAASGKAVSALAAKWTMQPGFPLVRLEAACPDGHQRITLTQQRFTIHQEKPAPLQWDIPLTWWVPEAGSQPQGTLLSSEPLTLAAGACSMAVALNAGGTGYFRVEYDEASFRKLAETITRLSEADRLTLLVDTWALVQAKRVPPEKLLGLLEQVAPSERGLLVWPEIVWMLRSMDGLLRGEPGQPAFRAWASALVRPELARLTWEVQPEESVLAKILRAHLLGALAAWGDAPTVAEARRRFAAYEQDAASLAADLRSPVFNAVARLADDATWERLHELARKAASTELKLTLYRALSTSQSPALAAKTLDLALTDELPPSDATSLVQNVAENGQLPELAWVFARQHQQALQAKLPSIRSYAYLPGIARSFNDASWADELEAFAQAKLPADAGPSVAESVDEIRFKSEFKTRFLPALGAWLQSRPAPQP